MSDLGQQIMVPVGKTYFNKQVHSVNSNIKKIQNSSQKVIL